jgi:ribonuclease HII
VYAAAVILPLERDDLDEALRGVADSKLLSPARREALLAVIEQVALGVGVGSASAAEVDAQGIAPATRLAMRRAVAALAPQPDALLLDYVALPQLELPQRSLPQADRRCLSVAAASIVAKVSRDRYMVELDGRCPGYSFARHKGYGTAAHRAALERLGPSSFHRVSWKPLQALKETGIF